MSVASEVAPEVDRLVLSVNGRRDTGRIDRAAADAGLQTEMPLHGWWDFLLAGRLTPRVALLRTRYRPEPDVRAWLDELVHGGFAEERPEGLAATAKLRPVLEALADEIAMASRAAWESHDEAVATATEAADQLAAAATDEYVVATVHRSIPRPDDPYGGLHSRLFTLRYIRQHDHGEAWASRGLTAPQMVVFTRLWNGEDPGGDTGARQELVSRGFVTEDGTALTAEGRDVRQDIEDDTNRRNARIFEVLDDGGAAFLTALRALPSA